CSRDLGFHLPDRHARRDAATMSKLSIIVPVLNEGERIAGALASLSDLRALGTEVIVVDGGSSDATVERAKPHADLVILAARGRASAADECRRGKGVRRRAAFSSRGHAAAGRCRRPCTQWS